MSQSKNNAQEREMELAFLAKSLPDRLFENEPKRITDIYLSSHDDLLNKIRLRNNGDISFELTKKVVVDPADMSVQDEYNIPLTKKEFELFSIIPGRVVTKDRYVIDMEGRRAEVDLFQGALKGFVIIEFEFDDVNDKAKFDPPFICGDEVTQEDFIAGAFLAGKSYSDIAGQLAMYGYRRLSYE